MKIFKKLGVVLSMAMVGSLMTAAPVSAKVNVTSQIRNTTNFAVLTTLSETQRKLFDKCRVTDPNKMNYNIEIKAYANKYLSLGYYVFDLKSMQREGVLDYSAEKQGLTDGIFVSDSYENNYMGYYIANLSLEGYEKGFLGGRKAQKATDYSSSVHDEILKRTFIKYYDPTTKIILYSIVCDPGYPMYHI